MGQKKDRGRSDTLASWSAVPAVVGGKAGGELGGGASSIPTEPGIVRSTPGMHRLALGDSGARGSHAVDFSATAR